jgi:hypothetical protein
MEEHQMKYCLIALFVLFSPSLQAQSRSKNKADLSQLEAAATQRNAALTELIKWKQVLADRTQAFSLRQKMQALVHLSEDESDEITEFLAQRKSQLEQDIKAGTVLNTKEISNYRAALDRIISARGHSKVADAQVD